MVPSINIKKLLESPVLIPVHQSDLDFDASSEIPNSLEEISESLEIEYRPSSILRSSTSPSKNKRVRFELPSAKNSKAIFSRSQSIKTNQKKLYPNCFTEESFQKRFFIIVHEFESVHQIDCPHPHLSKLYSWTKAIDIYSKILKVRIAAAKESMAFLQIEGKLPKNDESSKKFNKKLTDNRALIMTSPNEGNSEMCLMDKDRREFKILNCML